MNLYHVQDSDRPMYVVAATWMEALDAWKEVIRQENPDEDTSGTEPNGIALVAEDDELLVSRSKP